MSSEGLFGVNEGDQSMLFGPQEYEYSGDAVYYNDDAYQDFVPIQTSGMEREIDGMGAEWQTEGMGISDAMGEEPQMNNGQFYSPGQVPVSLDAHIEESRVKGVIEVNREVDGRSSETDIDQYDDDDEDNGGEGLFPPGYAEDGNEMSNRDVFWDEENGDLSNDADMNDMGNGDGSMKGRFGEGGDDDVKVTFDGSRSNGIGNDEIVLGGEHIKVDQAELDRLQGLLREKLNDAAARDPGKLKQRKSDNCIGLRTHELAVVADEFYSQEAIYIDKKVLVHFSCMLLGASLSEERRCGVYMLVHCSKVLRGPHLECIIAAAEATESKSDFTVIDFLSLKVFAPLVANNKHECRKVVLGWKDSSSPCRCRACCYTFAKLVPKEPDIINTVLSICRSCLKSRYATVKASLGVLLKEASGKYPNEVCHFIRENYSKMSVDCRKTAMSKLDPVQRDSINKQLGSSSMSGSYTTPSGVKAELKASHGSSSSSSSGSMSPVNGAKHGGSLGVSFDSAGVNVPKPSGSLSRSSSSLTTSGARVSVPPPVSGRSGSSITMSPVKSRKDKGRTDSSLSHSQSKIDSSASGVSVDISSLDSRSSSNSAIARRKYGASAVPFSLSESSSSVPSAQRQTKFDGIVLPSGTSTSIPSNNGVSTTISISPSDQMLNDSSTTSPTGPGQWVGSSPPTDNNSLSPTNVIIPAPQAVHRPPQILLQQGDTATTLLGPPRMLSKSVTPPPIHSFQQNGGRETPSIPPTSLTPLIAALKLSKTPTARKAGVVSTSVSPSPSSVSAGKGSIDKKTRRPRGVPAGKTSISAMPPMPRMNNTSLELAAPQSFRSSAGTSLSSSSGSIQTLGAYPPILAPTGQKPPIMRPGGYGSNPMLMGNPVRPGSVGGMNSGAGKRSITPQPMGNGGKRVGAYGMSGMGSNVRATRIQQPMSTSQQWQMYAGAQRMQQGQKIRSQTPPPSLKYGLNERK